MCTGRGSGPYKGFFPKNIKGLTKGGLVKEEKGKVWNVGSSSKALPIHFLCLESNPETPMIMILVFMTILLYYSGLGWHSTSEAFE